MKNEIIIGWKNKYNKTSLILTREKLIKFQDRYGYLEKNNLPITINFSRFLKELGEYARNNPVVYLQLNDYIDVYDFIHEDNWSEAIIDKILNTKIELKEILKLKFDKIYHFINREKNPFQGRDYNMFQINSINERAWNKHFFNRCFNINDTGLNKESFKVEEEFKNQRWKIIDEYILTESSFKNFKETQKENKYEYDWLFQYFYDFIYGNEIEKEPRCFSMNTEKKIDEKDWQNIKLKSKKYLLNVRYIKEAPIIDFLTPLEFAEQLLDFIKRKMNYANMRTTMAQTFVENGIIYEALENIIKLLKNTKEDFEEQIYLKKKIAEYNKRHNFLVKNLLTNKTEMIVLQAIADFYFIYPNYELLDQLNILNIKSMDPNKVRIKEYEEEYGRMKETLLEEKVNDNLQKKETQTKKKSNDNKSANDNDNKKNIVLAREIVYNKLLNMWLNSFGINNEKERIKFNESVNKDDKKSNKINMKKTENKKNKN